MPVRLNIDGVAGKAAIYTGTDDLPMSAPLDHISRVHFHSDLAMPSIKTVLTGTITLPFLDWNESRSAVYNISTHGLGSIPYCEGRITSIAGVPKSIGMTGSVPVATNGFAGAVYYARWLHLGATSTHVHIAELSRSHAESSFSSLVVGYEVYVTDMLLPSTGPAAASQPGVMVDITESRVRFGQGKFDTDNRYIRAGATGANFPMPKRETVQIQQGIYGADRNFTSWRWADGVTAIESDPLNGLSHMPTYTLVRI